MGGRPRLRLVPLTKYAVVCDATKKYVAAMDGSGKLAWTTDFEEAQRIANMIRGRIVDADEWRKNPTFIEPSG